MTCVHRYDSAVDPSYVLRCIITLLEGTEEKEDKPPTDYAAKEEACCFLWVKTPSPMMSERRTCTNVDKRISL